MRLVWEEFYIAALECLRNNILVYTSQRVNYLKRVHSTQQVTEDRLLGFRELA